MFMSMRSALVLPAPLGPRSASMVPDSTLQRQVCDGLGRPITATEVRGDDGRFHLFSLFLLPLPPNGVQHLGERQAERFGFDDEPLHGIDWQPSSAGSTIRLPGGHRRPDTRACFEQPPFDQGGDNLLRRVRIDSEFLAERPDGWEAVARLKLTGDHGLGDREHDLIVKRSSGPDDDAERQHGVYYLH